jgi:hypothetical protein
VVSMYETLSCMYVMSPPPAPWALSCRIVEYGGMLGVLCLCCSFVSCISAT